MASVLPARYVNFLPILWMLAAGCGSTDDRAVVAAGGGVDLLQRPPRVEGPVAWIPVTLLPVGLERDSDGLRSRGDGNGRWVANVAEDARLTRAEGLEVQVTAPAIGPFVLEVGLADRSSVEIEAVPEARPAPATLFFPWPAELRGDGIRIRSLALRPPLGMPGRVDATGARLRIAPAASWTGRVADRTRRALALAPGASVEWEVELPTRARWTFGASVLECGWVEGDGSRLVAELVDGESVQVLWQHDLVPAWNPDDRAWSDVSLDLADWGGRTVRVRLRAEPGPPPGPGFARSPDGTGDAPVFSSPRIVDPDDPRPNVVVILVDTLRRDALGLYGNPRPGVSPHLDAWSTAAVVFDRAHSTAPWTVPSTGSLLTGLLPPHHGKGVARDSDTTFLPDVQLVAEHFRAAGYATGMASNNPLIEPGAGFARGVDSFDHRALDETQTFGGERITAAAREWLSAQGGPFFLYLHYFDPHYRYQAPPPYTRHFVSDELAATEPDLLLAAQGDAVGLRARLLGRHRGVDPTVGPRELEWLHALYDAEVRYVDQCIRDVFDHLDALGVADDTVVVVTGDHGEEFLEHRFLAHGHTLYQELLAVPLLMSGPGIQPRREDHPVSLIDVSPTLVGLAGLPAWTQPNPGGRDLSGWLRGDAPPESRPLFAVGTGAGKGMGRPEHGPKRAMLEWPRKVIEDLGGGAVLYNLERDPAERAPQRGGHRAATTVLDSVLAPPANWREGMRAMSPELLEQLKAMGYVE